MRESIPFRGIVMPNYDCDFININTDGLSIKRQYQIWIRYAHRLGFEFTHDQIVEARHAELNAYYASESPDDAPF